MRRAPAFLPLILLTLSLSAGEPLPIEDRNAMVESGRNRDDAVWQWNSSYFRGGLAQEFAQEWGLASSRHQLAFSVPFYTDEHTGLGDTTVSYRYQLAGGASSRVAAAPRVSLILPTRSETFGSRTSGVQVIVPVTASVTPRLTSHTNLGATWYREEGGRELNLAQSFTFDVSSHAAIVFDTLYTHHDDDSHLLILRPAIQFAIDGPGGVQIAPAVAFPSGGGVLFSVAMERSIR